MPTLADPLWKDRHEKLALLHSFLIFSICILQTESLPSNPSSSNPWVRGICGIGSLLYALDLYLMVRGRLFDSIFVHHIAAIIIQALFFWFDQGLAYYQHFAWTELGTVLHKSSPYVPKAIRRKFQLLYLSIYAITYQYIIIYLVGLPNQYDVPSVASIPSEQIHLFGLLFLVLLLVFWSYQVFTAIIHVLKMMKLEKNDSTK